MSKDLKADIFIPTSNRLDSLRNCLTSLDIQTVNTFTIYIVGIEPDEKVEKLISGYSNLDVVYFIQSKPGIIGAANEALLRMKNDIFIRIDDDVVATPTWYASVINTFCADSSTGGVTGPTIMSERGIASRDLTSFLDRFQKSSNPLLRLLHYIYNDILYENKIREISRFLDSGVFTLGSNFKECQSVDSTLEVDNLEACNWSCRRDLLLQLKGFDEIFLNGLGDYHEADTALKIKKMGYRLVFNPKAALAHCVEIGTVPKARPAPFYRIQNFIIFYLRHFKFKKISQFFKFILNLIMQNCYYLFRFFSTGQISQLGAIVGTFVAMWKIFTNKSLLKYSANNN